MAQLQLIARPLYDTFSPGKLRETVSSGIFCIKFFHPGYSENRALILRLAGTDHPEGGVHHETARIACGIIAGNRWDGYLSESRNPERIVEGPDQLLRRSSYYFHVPLLAFDSNPLLPANRIDGNNAAYQYPIFPSFTEWEFPHNNLPKIWNDLELPPADIEVTTVLERNSTCRLTNEVETCEHAHLVPKSQEDWFSHNGMPDYNIMTISGSAGVDHISNQCRIRQDLHIAFDRKKFVFVPKRDPEGNTHLLIHLIKPSKQYAQLFQNVRLQDMRVSKEHLFARFAYSIFGTDSVNEFLSMGVSRVLLVGEDKIPEKVSPDKCRQFVAATKSQSKGNSQSPKKRSRGDEASFDEANPARLKKARRRNSDIAYQSDSGKSESDDGIRRMEELARGRSMTRNYRAYL
jgi:hypothetical protein